MSKNHPEPPEGRYNLRPRTKESSEEAQNNNNTTPKRNQEKAAETEAAEEEDNRATKDKSPNVPIETKQRKARKLEEGKSTPGKQSNTQDEDENRTPTQRKEAKVEKRIIYFDGAARGQGTPTVRCAIGVAILRDGNIICETISRTVETISTSQAAELSSFIEALAAINRITQQHLDTTFFFTVRGDSSHVINTVISGRLLLYDGSLKAPNALLWKTARTTWLNLKHQGTHVDLQWIPRLFNREADECCNAALDRRQVNEGIRSPPMVADNLQTVESEVEAGIRDILRRKRATIRTLPPELYVMWKNVYISITAQPWGADLKRKIFAIMPHILSAVKQSIKGRSDFKAVRTHLTMLTQPQYLFHTINTLAQATTPTPRQEDSRSRDERETNRSKILAQRGLFHKIIVDDKIFTHAHTPQLEEKLRKLFPQHTLPQPLTEDTRDAVHVTFANVAYAIRKLSSGKSPGLSGWTKELLLPLIFGDVPTCIQQNLCDIFQTYLNTERLSPEERALLQKGILIPLGYQGSEKVRPVIIKDSLAKCSWHILLGDIEDDDLIGAGSTYGRKGGAAAVNAIVQQALDDGHIIIIFDGRNAFNELFRQPAFDYVRRRYVKYHKCYPWINFNYAQATECTMYNNITGEQLFTTKVTAGTGQGCTSSGPFFRWATVETHRTFAGHSLSITDDIHMIIKKHDFSKVQPLLNEFAKIGLILNGPDKLCILTKHGAKISRGIFSAAPPSPYAATKLPTDICHAKILSTPLELHGGIIIPDRTLDTTANDECANIVKKAQIKIGKIINLKTSAQIRHLTLKATTHNYVYFISASAQSHHLNQACIRLQELYSDAFSQLTKVPKEILQVRLFNSIEDGGFSIPPFADCCTNLHEITIAATHQYTEIPIVMPIKHPSGARWYIRWYDSLMRKGLSPANRPLRCTNHPSWLTSWPNQAIRDLPDDIYETACQVRCGMLASIDYQCGNDTSKSTRSASHIQDETPPPKLQSLTPQERYVHVMTCAHCGKPQWHHRHEGIVRELGKSCSRAGIYLETNPTDLPLPGAERGGPDFVGYVEDKMYLGDVAVIYDPPRSTMRYDQKKKKYEDACEITSSICFPYIMSVTGVLDPRSIAILYKMICNNTRAFVDITVNTQFAMLRGIHQGIHRLKVRTSLGNLFETNEETN